MTIVKIRNLNQGESLGITIPANDAKELGLKATDYVNVNRVGNTLHITKVVIG